MLEHSSSLFQLTLSAIRAQSAAQPPEKREGLMELRMVPAIPTQGPIFEAGAILLQEG